MGHPAAGLLKVGKILVALDGSDRANKALRVSVDLAKRSGADLHSISIEEDLPHYAVGLLTNPRRPLLKFDPAGTVPHPGCEMSESPRSHWS
ncbi:universal stress protein [Nitrospira calida]